MLQLLQCGKFGFDLVQGFARRFQIAHMLRTGGVEFRQRGFGCFQSGLRLIQHARQFLQFHLFLRQPRRIGARQLRLFLLESAAANIELFDLALGVAEAVFIHLPRLLVLRDCPLRFAHRVLGLAQRLFFLRQMTVGCLACGKLGFVQRRLQARLLGHPLLVRSKRGIAPQQRGIVPRGHILNLLMQPLACCVLMLHALFNARHVRLRLVVNGLLRIERVLPGKMGLAGGLQRGFDLAQAGGFGFQSRLRVV